MSNQFDNVKPTLHEPATEATPQDTGNPQYQVVCISQTRLGDCGQFYWVQSSIDGTGTDGTKYCWLLLTNTQPQPFCEGGFSSPGYQTVCYSNVRLGDCGTYWNVKDSSAGCMSNGYKALWLLIE
jgi:hypothetical protein